MAIISGPGGFAVSAAEACGREGLKLADISETTRAELSRFVPSTGTSLSNPVDVGMTASLDMDIYIKTARLVAADPGVDTVVVAGIGMTPETNQLYTDAMIQAQKDFDKPFVMVKIPGFEPEYISQFLQSGVPFFHSAERALNTYAQVLGYQRWLREHA
ncbi:MAG: hypothetical protein GY866_23735 [Proteobacteria bacterium]|nr:hypothetical protein [Pseudomonadota bacterium]